MIPDPSVSTHHCEILCEGDSAVIRDLGSTNGTFVNQVQVLEAALQPGSSVRLGDVEMLFEAEAAASLPNAPATLPPQPEATEKTVIRLTPVRAQAPTAAVPKPLSPMATPAAKQAPPQIAALPATLGATGGGQAAVIAAHPCKHHPKSPGRFVCSQCGHHFCELCVTVRNVEGVQKKLCRHCGVECAPVQWQVQVVEPVGFFARLPGAFLYPLRGGGIMFLVIGTGLFFLLKAGAGLMRWGNIRLFVYGVLIQIVLGGYLYAFMQNVVQNTASEDNEMPQMPGITNFWDDILIPCFQFLGMSLICFGPALGVALAAAITDQPGIKIAIIPALLFGCVYFPMAFLAVSVLDTVAAANPMFIAPSILRVPKEYFVTVLLLAGVFVVRVLGDTTVETMLPNMIEAEKMSELFLGLALRSFWSLFGFYLLIVMMRILGLLFVTRKEELGWMKR